MAQITVLNVNSQNGGSFSVAGVFWLTAPTSNIVPLPKFESAVHGITGDEDLLLRRGLVIEKPFTSGLFPAGTSTEDVQSTLQSMFSEAQLEVEAVPTSPFVGMQYDGSSWITSSVSPAWIAAQVPPKTASGSPLMTIAQMQTDGTPMVALAPTVGSELVVVSHNLCDPCTWFGDSVRVNDETLVDSGDGLTFNSAHPFWIDMTSGRMHNEDKWIAKQQAANPGDPHGYGVVVKVSGSLKTMREPLETSGGDYEVLYASGSVRFFSPPVSPPVVSYSYQNGSTFYVQPDPGNLLRIIKAEVDVSTDSVMTDTVEYNIYALVDVVAPQLVAGGFVPSGTKIMIDQIVYKRMGQIVAEAQGAYPPVTALGANSADLTLSLEEFRQKSRGTQAPVQGLPFNYETTRDLLSSAGAEIRIKLRHDRPFVGSTVTIALYSVTKSDA
jgi:hypothetical protein